MSSHYTWRPMTTQILTSIIHGTASRRISSTLTVSRSQSQYTTQTTSKIHNVHKRHSGHLWHTRMSSGLTPTACVRTNTSEAPKSGSTASSRTSSTWSHAQKKQNVRSNSYNRSKMHLCRNRIFPTTMSLTKKVLIQEKIHEKHLALWFPKPQALVKPKGHHYSTPK